MWGSAGKGLGQFDHAGDIDLDNIAESSLCNRYIGCLDDKPVACVIVS